MTINCFISFQVQQLQLFPDFNYVGDRHRTTRLVDFKHHFKQDLNLENQHCGTSHYTVVGPELFLPEGYSHPIE